MGRNFLSVFVHRILVRNVVMLVNVHQMIFVGGKLVLLGGKRCDVRSLSLELPYSFVFSHIYLPFP